MVRAGYKQTEVGEIPEDWNVGNISEFVVGLVAGVSVNSTEDKDIYGKKCVLKTSCIYGGKFNPDEAKVIISNDYVRARTNPRKGSLIISRMNTPDLVGEIGYIPQDYSNLFLPDRLWQTAFKKGVDFNSQWLSFCLSYKPIAKQIKDTATGTSNSMKNISKESFLSVVVPKPSANEQKAIAKALSDVDELIASLEKLIAKKRDIKTATMQQLLTGKKRLPGFGKGKGYKQTELGLIPEDWDVKTYGDIFIFYTTASNSRDDLNENGLISYIHYGDIHTKWDITLDISKHNLPKIDRYKFKGAAFIKDGDVIMADASEDYEGIGKSIEVKGLAEIKSIAGLHTFLFRDNASIYAEGFRGYLHMIPAVKKSFDRLATGLKVYGISKNNLKTVFIPVPPKNEQEEIVDVLESMTKDIDSAISKLEKTKAIKQGLMQQLLTGKTRLIKPEGGQ